MNFKLGCYKFKIRNRLRKRKYQDPAKFGSYQKESYYNQQENTKHKIFFRPIISEKLLS